MEFVTGRDQGDFVQGKKQTVAGVFYEDLICFCRDIDGLMTQLGFEHKPDEWRLFIDGSTESLKAILLHNGNEKPSIPLAHLVDLKESYDGKFAVI